jgi:hypothetical protein
MNKPRTFKVSIPHLLRALAKNVPGFVEYFCEEQGMSMADEQGGASQ